MLLKKSCNNPKVIYIVDIELKINSMMMLIKKKIR